MRRDPTTPRRRISRSRIQYQSLESRNLLAAITVNTLSDNGDLSDGLISLREAIVATNTNTAYGDAPAGDADGDSIRIAPALAGQTISLSSDQLFITDDLKIYGLETTVEAAANARIFGINTSEEVVLSRLILKNGDVTQGSNFGNQFFGNQGGAVRFEGGGTLRLFRISFSNNSARLGGAVYAEGGNVYSFQSTFINNTALDASIDRIPTASSAGGAIYLAGQSATTVILLSTFEGNVAELGNGGAISVGFSDRAFIFSSEFTNNTAHTNRETALASDFFLVDGRNFGGGAISSSGFVRLGQSTFTDNSTTDGSGGAINVRGERFVVANTSFKNSSADTSGGAIYLQSGTNSKFNNARFTNNVAPLNGGAIYVAGPFVTPFGGPVDFKAPPSRLEIRSSFFSNNRAEKGGAINFSSTYLDGQVVISETTFLGNQADEILTSATGGAIHHAGGELQIYHSIFDNNEARNQNSVSRGGAVYSTDADVEIAFSSFSGNYADFGGAVAIEEVADASNLTIFESDFRQNRAGLPVGDPSLPPRVTAPFGDGGAIYLRSSFTFPDTVFRIFGGLFEGNIGTISGGAVAGDFGDGKLVISPSPNGATRFIGNRALAGDGGAISSSFTTVIRDAVFSENTARNGAAIFMGDLDDVFRSFQLTLSGAQITENEARVNGGGVFIASGVTLVNNSSNISSNTARNGDDIFEE